MILFLEVVSECFQASEAKVLRSFGFVAKPMGCVVDDCSYSVILLEFAGCGVFFPSALSVLHVVTGFDRK